MASKERRMSRVVRTPQEGEAPTPMMATTVNPLRS